MEDRGMEYERDGHKVRIGAVETERQTTSHGTYTGRKRHFRRIFIDDVEVHKAIGKSLDNARYHSAFELEYKIRMEKKLRTE
jgi:hypothetical protein